MRTIGRRLALSGLAALLALGAEAPALDAARQEAVAFGFAVGEERRYELGPREALRAGEFETWTLRLEEARGEPPDARYTFAYSYEMSRYGEGGSRLDYLGRARVTVNAAGFPLLVEYEANRMNGRINGANGSNGRMTWAGERFLVEPAAGARSPRSELRLPQRDHLRPSIPSGLFLSALDNPALISLPAALLQASGATTMEFSALQPFRLGGGRGLRSHGGGSIGRGRPGTSGTMGGGRGTGRGVGSRGRRGRSPGGDAIAYAGLEFRSIDEIVIAGQTVQAIRLRSRETGTDVYIDADGTVLRVDRPSGGRTDTYARLLRPWEY